MCCFIKSYTTSNTLLPMMCIAGIPFCVVVMAVRDGLHCFFYSFRISGFYATDGFWKNYRLCTTICIFTRYNLRDYYVAIVVSFVYDFRDIYRLVNGCIFGNDDSLDAFVKRIIGNAEKCFPAYCIWDFNACLFATLGDIRYREGFWIIIIGVQLIDDFIYCLINNSLVYFIVG